MLPGGIIVIVPLHSLVKVPEFNMPSGPEFSTVIVPELVRVPPLYMPELLGVWEFSTVIVPPLSIVMVSPLLMVINPEPLITRVVPDGIARLFPEVM